MPDHVHMMLRIPPKYAVSQVVGYIKGKSAIHLARLYGKRKRSFVGQSFWARGYSVSALGRDEQVIRTSKIKRPKIAVGTVAVAEIGRPPQVGPDRGAPLATTPKPL